jgi:dTDP-4-amino-4,6-dideoxygalactose transaminase
MSVPFVDLQRLHAPLRAELLAAMERVLDSGRFAQGAEVAAFEQEFAAAIGAPYAVAMNSGTAALHLALAAAGIGPGDEVILPANTFLATAEAVTLTGATPVLADVDEGTLNISVESVRRAMTPRTRALIPVHLYGRIADMAPLMELAREHRLTVIEDACQAHGATMAGRHAGTIGDIGCFSFYPTKNLGALGEGGMLVTSDPAVAVTAASLRDHGQSTRYYHSAPGYNYRLPELQAATLRVLLPHLESWNRRRQSAAAAYDARLRSLGLPLAQPEDPASHVYHLYVIRSGMRDALKAQLESRGIGVAVHYPVPIHLQEAYAGCRVAPGGLPVVEASMDEILSLPMHPMLTDDEIREVADAVAAFVTTPAEAISVD